MLVEEKDLKCGSFCDEYMNRENNAKTELIYTSVRCSIL
jgi:hypothetical protein